MDGLRGSLCDADGSRVLVTTPSKRREAGGSTQPGDTGSLMSNVGDTLHSDLNTSIPKLFFLQLVMGPDSD